MALLASAHQSGDTAHGNDASSSRCLARHLIRDRLSDVECSVHVDGLHAVIEGKGHIEESVERAYTSVGDENVDTAKCRHAGGDNLEGQSGVTLSWKGSLLRR